jgi:hypothetical protein
MQQETSSWKLRMKINFSKVAENLRTTFTTLLGVSSGLSHVGHNRVIASQLKYDGYIVNARTIQPPLTKVSINPQMFRTVSILPKSMYSSVIPQLFPLVLKLVIYLFNRLVDPTSGFAKRLDTMPWKSHLIEPLRIRSSVSSHNL